MNNYIYNELLGKTLVSIRDDEDELVLETTEGKKYKFHHQQDCCERVRIESIVGDLQDLVGSPLLIAEEVSNADDPDGWERSDYGTYTRTFYKFATRNGYVDVRWLGSSNGYYSESVSFTEIS